MREEEMLKALGQSFTHYVGKDEQLRQRTESELFRKKVIRVKSKQQLAAIRKRAEKMAQMRELASRKYVAGKYSFQRVLDICCAVYGVSEEELLSPARTNRLVRVRQQIVRVLRERRGMSYLEMGRRLNRDHSTLIHAYNGALANAEALKEEYEEILERLESYTG